jgi:hypothetical protein
MFQTKVVDKIKTHILCSIFFSENRAVYEIMWKQDGTARQAIDTTYVIWRMRSACWITNATNMHSEYVIFTAFSRQRWLRERASILCYTHIACLLEFIQIRFRALKEESLLLLQGYFEAHYLHDPFDYLFFVPRIVMALNLSK